MGNFEKLGTFDTHEQATKYLDEYVEKNFNPEHQYHMIQNRRGFWTVVVEK